MKIKNVFFQYFKYLIVIIIAIFFYRAISSNWLELASYQTSFNISLLCPLALLVPLYYFDAFGWHLILRGMAIEISPQQSISIWIKASFLRYVPGVIWTYISRSKMALEHGIPIKTAINSMLVENIMLALSAAAVGACSLLYTLGFDFSLALTCSCLITFCFLLSFPLINAIKPVLTYFPLLKKISSIKTRNAGLIYCYYLCFWIIFASIFAIFSLQFASSLKTVDFSIFLLLASSFTCSFFVGFIVTITPGGIGIREATLYGLISQILPPGEALIISAASRIWLMIGEAISALLLYSFNHATASLRSN